MAGRELADLAAVFGWPPVTLTYSLWVAMVLNVPRAMARRQAIVSTGDAIGRGAKPPDGWYLHLTDSPAEAAKWEADRLLGELDRRGW